MENLREQMVVDDEAVSACLHDGVPDCAAAETNFMGPNIHGERSAGR
jgi:hypothetical protein